MQRQPLLHPKTKANLESYLKRPTHGVLLAGREGAGKLFIAQWLAATLQLEPIVITSLDGKDVISIDQIRELYNFTRTGKPLAIIIEDSHRLGTEAQNAFLKLLEEPPANTHFILTSSDHRRLLETIRSRCQLIEVAPPPKKDLIQLAEASLPPKKAAALYITAEGLPGKFITLLDQDLHNNHQTAVAEAKEFYAGSAYGRHVMCAKHNFDRDWAKEHLNLLAIIVHSLLRKPGNNTAAIKKLLQQSELIELTAKNTLELPGNPKIHLAKLCQQL